MTLEEKLREALAGVMELVESGELVRDIKRDHQDDYHVRMIDLVSKLKVAQEALAAAPSLHKEGAGGAAQVRKEALEEAAKLVEGQLVYTGPGGFDPEPVQKCLALAIRELAASPADRANGMERDQ